MAIPTTSQRLLKKFNVSASDSLKLESSGRAQVTGSNATLEGSSMVKISSSGVAQVSGTPVKLG